MKRKSFAVITGLLLVCAMAFITTCSMDVDEPLKFVSLMDPYISLQPQSHAYFEGDMTDPPELSIFIKDWNTGDGSLSYQWYTFADLDDYLINGGTPIDGETDRTYTPGSAPGTDDDLKTIAGSKNYYYVTVTNDNPSVNVGVSSGTIQSEVAIISFTATGGALPPVITRHPGNASYLAGRAVNSINVRAAPRADREEEYNALLSYQWWSLLVDRDDTDDDEDGIPDNPPVIVDRQLIPNATGSSFEPDPTTLRNGENYFYVVVTSTETETVGTGESAVTTTSTASETSFPACISILPGPRALTPLITVQPKDKMYFTGETVQALSVDADSRDNGQISVQWFRNGEAVETGGTGKTLMPNITTTAAVDPISYYAEITNTNEDVTTSETTATVKSKTVKISVAASGTVQANATVTVANPKPPENRYQYVRGYGGMDVAWMNFPTQYPEETEKMFNPDGPLGFNINRIMISPGNVDPVIGIQNLGKVAYYYENVKIVNKYGGYNLASPWSPPKEWKSNNSINGGGKLIVAYRKQFAAYLRTFAQHMYDMGAPIYAISISNEPNYKAGYDGCEWDPEDMQEFYKTVGRFTEGVRGYGGGKYIPTVLTVNGESANNPDINVAAMKDPVSRSAIDLLCRHVYGNQTTTLWRFKPDGLPGAAGTGATINNILRRPDGTFYEVWMTEHNINSANANGYRMDSTWNYVWRFMNDVDLVMRLNNENAFVWWASKRFYSMLGDGQYGTVEGDPLPRGYGLSHYAKYTIDTHRVAAAITGTTGGGTAITSDGEATVVNDTRFSLDNTSPRITAYASIASGKDNAPINVAADDIEFISLVMWTPTTTGGSSGVNMGDIKIQMPSGFRIGSYNAIKSTGAGESNSHQPYTVTIDPDRTAAYVNLGPGQMLSVKLIKE